MEYVKYMPIYCSKKRVAEKNCLVCQRLQSRGGAYWINRADDNVTYMVDVEHLNEITRGALASQLAFMCRECQKGK